MLHQTAVEGSRTYHVFALRIDHDTVIHSTGVTVMAVGRYMEYYFKPNPSCRRVCVWVSVFWTRTETAKAEEGRIRHSAHGNTPRVDDCLARAHVSGIHHPVHIHFILGLSPLSLGSCINNILNELRNGSCLPASSGILFPLISAVFRQSRVSRKDSDLREFVRVTGATYVLLFSPLLSTCI